MMNLLNKDDILCAIDIKNAYRAVSIQPDDRPRQGLCIRLEGAVSHIFLITGSVWAYPAVLIYFLEFQTFWFDVHIGKVFVSLSTTLMIFVFCLTLNPRLVHFN